MKRRLAPAVGVGFDLWMLGLECSAVIAQRTLRIAAGTMGSAEASLMVSEKIEAGMALQRLALTGGLGLEPVGAAAKAVSYYRRKVRANGRRLSRP